MKRLTEVSNAEIAICALLGLCVGAWMLPAYGIAVATAFAILGHFLALITLVDARAFRIPDQLSLPLVPLGLLTVWWIDPALVTDRIIAVLAGGLGFYAVNFVYRRIRGFDGLGMGDVKLTAAAGAWVGLAGLAPVILIACTGALVAALILRVHLDGLQTRWTRLPFGSSEAPALLVTVLWLF